MAFISPSFLNNSLTGYRIYGWQFFSFTPQKVFCSFLALVISDKRAIFMWLRVPYSIAFSLYCSFNTSFFAYDFSKVYLWWIHGCVGVYPTWDLFSFLNLCVCAVHQIWAAFTQHPFKLSFCPSLSPSASKIPSIWMLSLCYCLRESWGFVNFFQPIYSQLFRSVEFYWSIPKFINFILSCFYSTLEPIQ